MGQLILTIGLQINLHIALSRQQRPSFLGDEKVKQETPIPDLLMTTKIKTGLGLWKFKANEVTRLVSNNMVDLFHMLNK